MKQSPSSDKYNIAWFKLAEFVSRGEKEKALGIYRLLCHSIDDRAFARQLEGDILWTFNDALATEKYIEAAELYRKEKKILQAAAVYEHLVTLQPNTVAYLEQVFELYVQLQIKAKIVWYGEKLFTIYRSADNSEQMKSLLNVFEQCGIETTLCR